jgi:hypothetical protein
MSDENLAIKLETIETIAKQVKEELEREAIRTIRQRNPDKGKICLDKIDGVEQFMYALRMATNSVFYRQRGDVRDDSVPVIRNHRKTEIHIPKPRKSKRVAAESASEPTQISKAG